MKNNRNYIIVIIAGIAVLILVIWAVKALVGFNKEDHLIEYELKKNELMTRETLKSFSGAGQEKEISEQDLESFNSQSDQEIEIPEHVLDKFNVEK